MYRASSQRKGRNKLYPQPRCVTVRGRAGERRYGATVEPTSGMTREALRHYWRPAGREAYLLASASSMRRA